MAITETLLEINETMLSCGSGACTAGSTGCSTFIGVASTWGEAGCVKHGTSCTRSCVSGSGAGATHCGCMAGMTNGTVLAGIVAWLGGLDTIAVGIVAIGATSSRPPLDATEVAVEHSDTGALGTATATEQDGRVKENTKGNEVDKFPWITEFRHLCRKSLNHHEISPTIGSSMMLLDKRRALYICKPWPGRQAVTASQKSDTCASAPGNLWGV